jgi:predicted nicotinamide N-methyase
VEEEDEEIDVVLSKNGDDTDTLRADPFERTFAIKWLTGLISRSDTWISFASNQDDEDERYQIMDEITGLLSAFAVDDQTEEALTRNFSFPLANEGQELNVELNDAPIANEDHTSVGLQSWASSILLATRMCAAPVEFGFGPVQCAGGKRRILELGAGTGLLSIVAAKLLCGAHCDTKTEVVATDYHPDVLSNLISNIQTNFPSSTLPPIRVHRLDWQYPLYAAPLDSSFELILAADVVYQPEHAGWIKGCVERLLLRPEPFSGAEGGIFWLIIALRSTGRHEGLSDTVDELFPDPSAFRPRSKEDESSDRVGGGEWKLAVLGREEVSKQDGFGRADESGYKLFKIGWVKG